MLEAGYATHGKSWVKLSSMIPGRTQRQCRTRWVQLNKDNHKEDEDKEKEKKEKEVAEANVIAEANQGVSPVDSYFEDDSDCYDED